MVRPAYLVAPALGVAGVLLILSGCITEVGSPASAPASSAAAAARSGTTAGAASGGASGGTASGRASGGGASAGATRSAGAGTASPSGSAVARSSPPALPAVSGYTFGTAPATVAAGVEKLSDASPTVFGDPTVKSVKRGKTDIGTVALMALSPAYVGQDSAEQSLVDGLVKGMAGAGYTLGTTALHGRRVVVATTKGSTILAWYDQGKVALFLSAEPKDVPLAFADAYLAT